MNNTGNIRSTAIPAIRYKDPNRLIEWLKTALGFSEKAVYRDAAGIVEHAELVLGNGMVMIGTAGHNQQSAHWFVQPDAIGAVTASVYLVVQDFDRVYASVKSTGAKILQDLETKGYGGRSMIVRDPEGQIWSLGEYDPWA